MGDPPVAWYSLKISYRARKTRGVQLPDPLPPQLPSVAFWNASSLCAADVHVAKARISHLKSLIRRVDVAIVCEVHPRDDWVEDLSLDGFASWLSRDNNNPHGAGGVLVVMQTRFARRHRAHVIPVWSGRMVHICLQMGACKINIMGVHLAPVPPIASWEHLACALHGHTALLAEHDPLIIIGDFNFVSSREEAIRVNDGQAVGQPGPRSVSWARKYGSLSELSGGLTFFHKVTGQMRANDRAYLSLSPSCLMALHARVQVSPPMTFGESDHRSIILTFNDDEGIPFRAATWPFLHPSWAHTLQGVIQGWRPSGDWVADVKSIEAAVEQAS